MEREKTWIGEWIPKRPARNKIFFYTVKIFYIGKQNCQDFFSILSSFSIENVYVSIVWPLPIIIIIIIYHYDLKLMRKNIFQKKKMLVALKHHTYFTIFFPSPLRIFLIVFFPFFFFQMKKNRNFRVVFVEILHPTNFFFRAKKKVHDFQIVWVFFISFLNKFLFLKKNLFVSSLWFRKKNRKGCDYFYTTTNYQTNKKTIVRWKLKFTWKFEWRKMNEFLEK